jgi:hypothetical protein
VRADQDRVQFDLDDVRADDGIGQRDHQIDQGIDVGRRPPAEAGEEWVAP